MAELREKGPWRYALATMISAGLLSASSHPVHPLLVWNATKSSPIGFYAITAGSAPEVGDIVLAWAPRAARRLAAARGYVPFAVPLVKSVAAGAGNRICAEGPAVFIDGKKVAVRQSTDPSGRRMPWWSACHQLRPGEYLLLSAGGPQAFDGRYFGTSRRNEIIGRARLLWTR